MVESEAHRDLREPVFQLAVKNQWAILALQQKRLSLEEVFRALTHEGQNGNGKSHD
jgi:hypothetical protein